MPSICRIAFWLWRKTILLEQSGCARRSYHAAIRRRKATAKYHLPAILVDDYSFGPEPGLQQIKSFLVKYLASMIFL